MRKQCLNLLVQTRCLSSINSNKIKIIKNKIYQCQSSNEIKEIIKYDKLNEIDKIDKSIFGAAIKKCGKLKNWKLAIKIFNLMDKYKIDKSLIEYNIIINTLCKNDKIEIALNIFKNIPNNISIDIEIYNCLISGCKYRNNIKLAENLWNELHLKQELKPDLITYNSMINIYTKCGLMNKSEYLFKTMYNKINKKPDSITCALMMNGYSFNGDKKKIIKLQNYMIKNKIEINEIHYSCIMRYYLLKKQSFQALDFFNYEIKQKLNKNKINKLLIHQLCCCYLQIMEQNINKKRQISKYYNMITKIIPNQYGYLPSNSVLFDALLIIYNNNWKKIITKFENGINNKEINNYLKKSNEFNEYWIDLHSHSKISAKFILYYLFYYKTNFIKDNKNNVIILCGKGIHNDINNNSMKQIVKTELLSFNPPIKTSIYHKESACLICDIQDLENFLSAQHKI